MIEDLQASELTMNVKTNVPVFKKLVQCFKMLLPLVEA